MQETKHTPGPWVIGAIESGQFAIDGADGQDVTGWLNSEADARLIAAAPELLDALSMWMDIHNSPAGFEGKYGKALDAAIAAQQIKVDAAVKASHEAIAKATIQQQKGGA